MKPSLLLQRQTKGWIVHITVGGGQEQFLKGTPLNVFKENLGHFLALFVVTKPDVFTEPQDISVW